MNERQYTNKLIAEKSPYLLQHAHNPVDWYPWGDEAFERAKREDKPIFLSIGYSTCHWCHVMERESFEDTEVAHLLNQNFVPIKVDREERPDVDNIYMTACQALTGSGGWPLTVFMSPDGKPFFTGTYFPKNDHARRPGLITILEKVSKSWKENKETLLSSGNRIVQELFADTQDEKWDISPDPIHDAFLFLTRSFDRKYGGFGSAPKFPTPHNLLFLLRYWYNTKNARALEIVETTLESMYKGGIYDHIGHGFSRYSTDNKWLVPHFEKMLYDNALLAIAYTECYHATKKDFYKTIAKEISDYVLRDMTSPDGGFYSAEDADSEGIEGLFYVWTPDEIKEVLGEERGEIFCRNYDITFIGNFEGKSIPNLIKSVIPQGDSKTIEECKKQLFLAREKRVHPFKDDKILTSWNGLMIAAMSSAGRIFKDE
ncbi:MAG TPA: thioredoxin domain-containing protein, partial [Clostridia bacterium]